MTVRFDEAAIPGRHHITYRVRDAHAAYPVRDVEVLATADELAAFDRQGYIVRERLLPMDQVELLRAALDETVERDNRLETEGGRAFGGIFIRHLMDKHPAFLEFLTFAPTLSVARAVLGPYVQIRGLTGRVCYPDDPNQETEWHFHQNLIPDPIPPWFSRPQTMDVLLYLDDLTDLNGPLCVLPGSHRRTNEDLDEGQFDDLPGQVVLHLPAGSLIMANGSLWHRALPTRPGGTMRRLLIIGYGPTWMKGSIYGERPADGLTRALLADADQQTRELLGVAGFN
jgi:ectoine hydroxylase-related dioxygenase (phytanoyl-CoA dioxygenase family)